MKNIRRFTLVELLVVVGIIVILAGLILPAVIGGAENGRITQAKSDIQSIIMACKQMDTTYGKMVTKSGANYTFDGKNAKFFKEYTIDSKKYNFLVFGPEGTLVCSTTTSDKLTSDEAAASKAFVAELCGFDKKKNSSSTEIFSFNTNKRKIKFLDLKSSWDPSKGYDDDANKNQLWLDPWGNPYVIMINTDYTDQIPHPNSHVTGTPDTNKILSGKIIVFSFGPNGVNDNGTNVNEGGAKNADDIASWHK